MDSADRRELDRLYEAGQFELVEVVLSVWRPADPPVADLVAAGAPAGV